MDEMTEPTINTEAWVEIDTERKPGVRKLTRNDTSLELIGAYFKYPPSGQDGPVSANEFVASRLGRMLNLPIAKVQFHTFDGVKGILSYVVAVESNTWNELPPIVKTDLEQYLIDFQVLPHIMVFDAWINNIDRHGANFIASRTTVAREPRYQVHMIDHGHSLLGPTIGMQIQPLNVGSHVRLEELDALKSRGMDFFEEAVRAITDLKDADIEAVVDLVPDEYITPSQRADMKALLLQRKENLYNEVKKYVEA